MKHIILRRTDFRNANPDVNYWQDYLLTPLGIPQHLLDKVNEVDLFVDQFIVIDSVGDTIEEASK